MVYIIIIVLLLWVWIISDCINAPHLNNDGTIKKDKK